MNQHEDEKEARRVPLNPQLQAGEIEIHTGEVTSPSHTSLINLMIPDCAIIDLRNDFAWSLISQRDLFYFITVNPVKHSCCAAAWLLANLSPHSRRQWLKSQNHS